MQNYNFTINILTIILGLGLKKEIKVFGKREKKNSI